MDFYISMLLLVIFLFMFFKTLVPTIKEARSRKLMIEDTNDSTVSSYINIYRKIANDFILRNFKPGQNGSFKIRRLEQAQAYEIVVSSSNVSQNLKDELKSLYIKSHIPIKK